MNISYDKINKTYMLDNTPYTKEQFMAYIDSDMLQSALATQAGSIDIKSDDINFLTGGKNIILMGAPGTGKSHDADRDYGRNSIRCVFHNDYTNSDFVGTYKPVPTANSTSVTYEFRPGPFTIALLNAYNQPQEMHNLIIEEINRADASAVFGEIFQLLDRTVSGNSEYSIQISREMLDYFKTNLTAKDETLKTLVLDKSSIILPSNLNIVATMNSSDQGVFTLDTAFKRRWIFKFKEISFTDVSHKEEELIYCGQPITWQRFAETLNRHIVLNGLPEDRQLGPYFLKAGEVSDVDTFCSKLLYYLWNDIAKYNKDLYFVNAYKFSELVSNYKNGLQIFSETLHNLLIPSEN
jgi:5-methylcytosine-specific restriction enzyme B